ncbi:MAG: TlpA disulfide reductase family protein [Terracidiphilus sp.]|jgi:thiol-disulfide isomerase/thioredoxin
MTKTQRVPVLLDILSGVAAIIAVVGTCIALKAVGDDFRVVFGLTAAAFFLAGITRGKLQVGSLGWQVVRVSAGGLLGTAALVVNNGPHLVLIQAGLVLTAVALSATGILARRSWHSDRRFSLRLTALSLIAAGVVVFAAVPKLSSYSAFEATDRPLPAFSLQADNHIIRSEELRGRVVVLAFWASWCLQCMEELPELQRVYARYQNDPEIVFLAVDTGWEGETMETGKRRLAQRHLELPVVFDPGPAAQTLGVDGLPALILIDRNGSVKLVHHGYDRSEHLEYALTREIEELRKETRQK